MIVRIGWAICLSLFAALLLADSPCGIRACNPGNIHGLHWKEWGGATQTDENEYLRFKTPLDGLKAMDRVLVAYHERYGIKTVSGIVHRWVREPRNEQQERQLQQYIAFVALNLGVHPKTKLDMDDPRELARIAKAIIFAENSEQPYPDSLFKTAFGY